MCAVRIKVLSLHRVVSIQADKESKERNQQVNQR